MHTKWSVDKEQATQRIFFPCDHRRAEGTWRGGGRGADTGPASPTFSLLGPARGKSEPEKGEETALRKKKIYPQRNFHNRSVVHASLEMFETLENKLDSHVSPQVGSVPVLLAKLTTLSRKLWRRFVPNSGRSFAWGQRRGPRTETADRPC